MTDPKKTKEVKETKTVKESMEILDGVEVIVDAAADIMSDGKVDLSDIQAVVGMAKKFDVLKEAVDGAGDALKELKDLDEMELIQLGTKSYKLIKKIKDIF